MDKIKGLLGGLLGSDGKFGVEDVKAQMENFGLEDLANLEFPATKDEVVDTMSQHGSPDLLINAVDQVPQETFNSVGELKDKLPI